MMGNTALFFTSRLTKDVNSNDTTSFSIMPDGNVYVLMNRVGGSALEGVISGCDVDEFIRFAELIKELRK